jgi:spore coat polysaccharide biosynthesis protein SpsF (cytidylyltransferase family)
VKAVIAVQARLKSTRLPRKILMDLCGKPMLSQIVRRCRATGFPVFVSAPPEDEADIVKETGLDVIAGPEKDVLLRMLLVAAAAKATHVVRVTGDCPLAPHDLIVRGMEEAIVTGSSCIQNWRPRTFPDGFDFEVWYVPFLVSLAARMKPESEDREWFAQWCLDQKIPNIPLTAAGESMASMRLTVDYQEDLDVIRDLYTDQGNDIWESGKVVEWCREHPEIMAKNAMHVKDFGARPK